MRRGTLEVQKIVAWTIGVLIALVIIWVIIKYLGDGENSFVQLILEKLNFK